METMKNTINKDYIRNKYKKQVKLSVIYYAGFKKSDVTKKRSSVNNHYYYYLYIINEDAIKIQNIFYKIYNINIMFEHCEDLRKEYGSIVKVMNRIEEIGFSRILETISYLKLNKNCDIPFIEFIINEKLEFPKIENIESEKINETQIQNVHPKSFIKKIYDYFKFKK